MLDTLRKMTVEELTRKEQLPAVRELFHAIFPKEAQDNECFAQSLTTRDLTYWMYFMGKVPVGMSGLYVEDADPSSAWLGWFGVVPEYRRMGIGDTIIKWHEHLIDRSIFTHSRLYTNADNEPAIRFHKKHGYKGEEYKGEIPREVSELGRILIFSKPLRGELEPWGDRHLDF